MCIEVVLLSSLQSTHTEQADEEGYDYGRQDANHNPYNQRDGAIGHIVYFRPGEWL